MSPNFLQICKSNKKIGLGHVMRSLSLYSKIKHLNKKVVFFYYGIQIIPQHAGYDIIRIESLEDNFYNQKKCFVR